MKFYNPLHILDKKISFHKKNKDNKDLINCKLFVLFNYRYGLGGSIINKICFYSGIKPHKNVGSYNYNLYNKYYSIFFKFYQKLMDNNSKSYMIQNLKRNVTLYNYIGSRYLKYLPLHGQRRRCNHKTSKRVRILPLYNK